MNDKLRDLVRAAIDKTSVGGLKWTNFGSDSFRTKIGPGHLHIARGFDRWSDEPKDDRVEAFVIQITNAQGRVAAEDTTPRHEPDFALASQLFDTARRSAFGTDQVIEDMLQSLRQGAC